MARDGTCGNSRRSGGTSATRGFLCRELQRRSKEAAGMTEWQSSGAGAAKVLAWRASELPTAIRSSNHESVLTEGGSRGITE